MIQEIFEKFTSNLSFEYILKFQIKVSGWKFKKYPREDVNMTNEIICVVLISFNWTTGVHVYHQTFSVDPDTMTVPIWFIARL